MRHYSEMMHFEPLKCFPMKSTTTKRYKQKNHQKKYQRHNNKNWNKTWTLHIWVVLTFVIVSFVWYVGQATYNVMDDDIKFCVFFLILLPLLLFAPSSPTYVSFFCVVLPWADIKNWSLFVAHKFISKTSAMPFGEWAHKTPHQPVQNCFDVSKPRANSSRNTHIMKHTLLTAYVEHIFERHRKNTNNELLLCSMWLWGSMYCGHSLLY